MKKKNNSRTTSSHVSSAAQCSKVGPDAATIPSRQHANPHDSTTSNLLRIVWDRIRNDPQYRDDYFRSTAFCTDTDLEGLRRRWNLQALIDPDRRFQNTDDFLYALDSFIPDRHFVIVNHGTEFLVVCLETNRAVPLGKPQGRKRV